MSRDFIRALYATAQRHPRITLYLFGSTLRGADAPNDLDLLAVYATEEDYDEFRTDLDRLEFSPLIDLVAMTATELANSGFLRRSAAIPFADLT